MRLLVVGAGGHAKVVIDAARAAGHDVVAAVGSAEGTADILGIPVVPDATAVTADGFIIAVGDNRRRAALFSEYVVTGLAATTVVHPSAVIAASAEIADGTFVAAGAVVNPSARIGCNVILNTGCTIDHDCVVADHAHIGPGVNVCGGTSVGSGTLLGVGSCAMPGVQIGAWSVVGAGAAIVSDLPARMVCTGVPARPTHPVEDAL